MEVFKLLEYADHEQVAFCVAPAVGLRAIVVIHDTTLGPALAGIQVLDDASEETALSLALRLSETLTLKAALSGVNYGGGEIILCGQPAPEHREAAFRALGRFIQGLGGRIIGAPDVGTSTLDLSYVARETDYVAGVNLFEGNYDPSYVAAEGIFNSLKVSLKETGHSADFKNLSATVQGVGAVGSLLAPMLAEAGATVYINDLDRKKQARLIARYPSLKPLTDGEIFTQPVDIFCPCGQNGIIQNNTLSHLAGRIVCGGTNLQLASSFHDYGQLTARGITYAPDFAISGGAMVSVVAEREGHPTSWIRTKMAQIPQQLRAIYSEARERETSTVEVAKDLALRRIGSIASLAHSYTPPRG
jgi:leucine dehydrogenase